MQRVCLPHDSNAKPDPCFIADQAFAFGFNASMLQCKTKTPSSTYENGVKSGILITLYYGWKSTALDASDSPILLLADTLNHPLVDAGTP